MRDIKGYSRDETAAHLAQAPLFPNSARPFAMAMLLTLQLASLSCAIAGLGFGIRYVMKIAVEADTLINRLTENNGESK